MFGLAWFGLSSCGNFEDGIIAHSKCSEIRIQPDLLIHPSFVFTANKINRNKMSVLQLFVSLSILTAYHHPSLYPFRRAFWFHYKMLKSEAEWEWYYYDRLCDFILWKLEQRSSGWFGLARPGQISESGMLYSHNRIICRILRENKANEIPSANNPSNLQSTL